MKSLPQLVYYFGFFFLFCCGEIFALNNTKDPYENLTGVSVSKKRRKHRDSVLHVAAKSGDVEMMKVLLVRQTTEVNLKNQNGDTAADVAIRNQKRSTFQGLLKVSASFNVESFNDTNKPEDEVALAYNDKFWNLLSAVFDRRNTLEVETMVFVYPIFVSDYELFQGLRILFNTQAQNPFKNLPMKIPKAYYWQIEEFLSALIVADFPNGLLSKNSLQALQDLLNELDGAALTEKVWLAVYDKFKKKAWQKIPRASSSLPNFSSAAKLWDNLNAVMIAHAITQRDRAIFERLSLRELWNNDSPNAYTVKEIKKSLEQTDCLLAYIVIADKKNRDKQIDKLLSIGDEFLRLNNFWGVAQILITINKPDVARLITLSEKAQERHDRLMQVISENHNYAVYRKILAKIPSDEFVLPLLALIFRDAVFLRETKTGSDLNEWLKLVENHMRAFSTRQKNFSINLEHNAATAFFEVLPVASPEIISEMSEKEKPRTITNDFASESPSDISSSYFNDSEENRSESSGSGQSDTQRSLVKWNSTPSLEKSEDVISDFHLSTQISEWSFDNLDTLIQSFELQSMEPLMIEVGIRDGETLLNFLKNEKNNKKHHELYAKLQMMISLAGYSPPSARLKEKKFFTVKKINNKN